MRHWKKIVIGLAAFLILFTLIGFFALPPLLKNLLQDKLSETLHRPVSIQAIAVNPYLLRLTVKGFQIQDRSGKETFAAFDELFIDLESSSLVQRALVIKALRLTGPRFRIARHDDGTYNFSDLIPAGQAPPKQEEKKRPFFFSIDNIRIEKGDVDFWDGPMKTRHTVKNLLVTVPVVSNMAHRVDVFTEPLISATIDGSAYVLKGRTKPFKDSLETIFDVDIDDINIPHYLAYVPSDLNLKIPSGQLDAHLEISFTQYKDRNPSLVVTGRTSLDRLAVTDRKGKDLLKLHQLLLTGIRLEPFQASYTLSEVVLDRPEVHVARTSQGEWNLLTVAPPSQRNGEKPPTRADAAKGGDTTDTGGLKGQAAAASREQGGADRKKEATPPPRLEVGSVKIREGTVLFRDELPPQPVRAVLGKLNLSLENVSTVKGNKSDLHLSTTIDRKGTLTVDGPFVMDPVSADLALKLRSLAIRPFQPYFNDKILIDIARGDVSVEGKLVVKGQEKAGDKTPPAKEDKGLSIQYQGGLLVANFHALDRKSAEDFLSWQSLHLNNIKAVSSPLAVDVGQIALSGFYSRVVFDREGKLNLQQIVATSPEETARKEGAPAAARDQQPPTPATADKTPQQKQPSPIRIGAITLQGGTVDFQDQLIKPPYAASLSEIGGRVGGLSSLDEKPADVELRGKFERFMPLEITGRIHPLRKDLFADIKATFRDMDLSPTSSYSAKYIGRKIQKGKLSFDLQYLIDARKLQSENRVFIDQLTLGEEVSSPEATKLPVGLAIALLKDRNGRIDLDIPVSGSLDDPQFSIWKIVVKVLVNLLTKAATAPFALLGSLLGGGAELSHVEFDYGHATVPEAGVKKIDALARALFDRPALKLEITGHVDPEKDREGLKTVLLDRKVRAAKLKDMMRQGEEAAPLEKVNVSPAEYEKYLALAYAGETFPKPRTAGGAVKALPAAEMEKLILTNTAVGEEELKGLATQRARHIRERLLQTGKTSADRLFLLEPKTLAPEKKDKIRDSRVDFSLK